MPTTTITEIILNKLIKEFNLPIKSCDQCLGEGIVVVFSGHYTEEVCPKCKGSGHIAAAKKAPILEVGTRLYTRDGRFIGNSKIVGIVDKNIVQPNESVQTFYELVTDFGNKATFTAEEINSAFYLERG